MNEKIEQTEELRRQAFQALSEDARKLYARIREIEDASFLLEDYSLGVSDAYEVVREYMLRDHNREVVKELFDYSNKFKNQLVVEMTLSEWDRHNDFNDEVSECDRN